MELIEVCAGCLCAGRALRALTGSPYEEYFASVLRELLQAPLDLASLLVCWECVATLRRLTHFRRQVERSLSTLSQHSQMKNWSSDISTISRQSNLRIVPLEQTTFPQIADSEIKQEQNELSDDEIKNDSELKIEFCDRPDDEQVEVKSEATREMRIKKFKKRKKNRNKTEQIERNEGMGMTKSGKERVRRNVKLDPEKIRTILLSEAELRTEREKDAQSEAYLKLPYRCEDCIQGFDHEQTLGDHMDRKHNLSLGKFQCETCKSVLGSLASYNTHCRRHLLRFECLACGKRTIDKTAMVKHYGAEHEAQVTSYSCAECGFVSQSYRTHRYHKEKHREKPQCEDCGKTFINKNTLRCHILNMHRGGRTFACDTCGKTYKGKSGLLMHMWTHDARARAHAYCAQCRVHFNTLYNYRNHLRKNRNHRTPDQYLFACDECDKRFPTQRHMRQHVDFVHLNSSEYQCHQCSKRFKQRAGLERHRKFVHEKVRPPRDKMCHHCGRGFTTASILRTHIRTHTGERPLACTSCVATFSHSAALYTHNKLVHGGAR